MLKPGTPRGSQPGAKRYLNMVEAGRALNMSPGGVLRQVQVGQIKTKQVGKKRLISESEIKKRANLVTRAWAAKYVGVPRTFINVWIKRGVISKNSIEVRGNTTFLRKDRLERIKRDMLKRKEGQPVTIKQVYNQIHEGVPKGTQIVGLKTLKKKARTGAHPFNEGVTRRLNLTYEMPTSEATRIVKYYRRRHEKMKQYTLIGKAAEILGYSTRAILRQNLATVMTDKNGWQYIKNTTIERLKKKNTGARMFKFHNTPKGWIRPHELKGIKGAPNSVALRALARKHVQRTGKPHPDMAIDSKTGEWIYRRGYVEGLAGSMSISKAAKVAGSGRTTIQRQLNMGNIRSLPKGKFRVVPKVETTKLLELREDLERNPQRISMKRANLKELTANEARFLDMQKVTIKDPVKRQEMFNTLLKHIDAYEKEGVYEDGKAKRAEWLDDAESEGEFGDYRGEDAARKLLKGLDITWPAGVPLPSKKYVEEEFNKTQEGLGLLKPRSKAIVKRDVSGVPKTKKGRIREEIRRLDEKLLQKEVQSKSELREKIVQERNALVKKLNI